MTDTLHRYPGAQPFRDDEISRRTFFGREPDSIALADQVLANRLVVVYAKSGMGKTSLLNAGVAPRLREANSVPLFVRVNDIKNGPLHSVLEGIRAGAERQHVEYVHGETDSLWSFFKSVEFWRGDLLLSPVLILDQFEELFTLQSEEARDKFVSELGYLVRGIPPPGLPQSPSGAGNKPPSVRVVLSLREDFLGLLEEASDRIPQIMDHRFRLAPLDRETAASAITGPAAIPDPSFATKPFRFEPEFVTSILDYLTKSTPGHGSGNRYVEPFQLQLICQRIEKIVALKQQASSEGVVFSFTDFGGEAALAQTLESFYKDAIRSVPGKHVQAVVRLLCEEFLISPEGRRLSIEERELQRQLKLPRETLAQLVEGRLLRTDRRSDSTYYELSHDTLVQPVLASRRVQALVVGWVAVIGGAIVTLVAAALILLTIAFVFSSDNTHDFESYCVIFFLALATPAIGALGIAWFRAGLRRRRRYGRHAPSEIAEQLPTLLPLKDRVLGWVALVAGSAAFVWASLSGLYLLVVLGSLHFTGGKFPNWLAWANNPDMLDLYNRVHGRPFVRITWLVVKMATIVVFGWMVLRQGAQKLWPHKFAGRPKASSVLGLDQPPSLVLASLKVLSGGIALVAAVLGFFTLGTCVSGNVPDRFIQAITDISSACNALYMKEPPGLDTVTVVLFCLSALVLSIALLRGGALDIRNVLRHRRLGGLVWPKVAATVCGILIIASLLSWEWTRLHSSEQAVWAQAQQASYAVAFCTRGVERINANEYEHAVEDFDHAIRLKSNFPEAFYSRGRAYHLLGQDDRAIQDYDQAILLKPTYPGALNNRGLAHVAKGQYDRAIQDYDEAIRLKPKGAWTFFENRGRAKFYLGNFPDAAADFQQSLSLNSSRADTMIWLHLARQNAGQDDSERFAKQAGQIDFSKWPGPVVSLFLGRSTPQQTLAAATNPDPIKAKEQGCEAEFFVGEYLLLAHKEPEALAHFGTARDTCPHNFFEYTGAVAEIGRLGAKPKSGK